MTAHYFDVTPLYNYFVEVYRSDSALRSRSVNQRTSAGIMLDSAVKMGTLDSNCGLEFCTDSSTHKGWYYADAERPVDDITEAKAKIRTRYGQLCGEPNQTSNALAHITAHAGIASGDTMWAQTGFIRFRDESGLIDQRWYFEIITPGYPPIAQEHPTLIPQEDSLHEYKLEIDPSGEWIFTFDGNTVGSQIFIPWIGETGDIVHWTGESAVTKVICQGQALIKSAISQTVNTKLTSVGTMQAFIAPVYTGDLTTTTNGRFNELTRRRFILGM